jgi:hypothetical protein
VLTTIFAGALFVVFVVPAADGDARPLAADDVHTREGRQGHEEVTKAKRAAQSG